MKERITRFLGLSFYMACWDRGVEVKSIEGDQSKRETMKGESSSSSSSSSMVKVKKSWGFVAPSRSSISKVVDKLIRSTFKIVTRIFAYKDFEDIECETELEIGLPTDVKHVTHIGCDGSVTTNPDKNWDHFQPPETLSLEQIGLQMAKVEKQDP